MQLKIINSGAKICSSCANLIQNYYSFRLKVINSDESFCNANIIKNEIKSEPEDSSSRSQVNANEKCENHMIEDDIGSPETIDNFEDPPSHSPIGAKHNKKGVRCKLCDKEFLSRGSLKNHKCPVFECPTCLDRFDTKKYLTAHLKTHPKSKKLFCKYCEQWVNYPRASLIVHLRVNILT